MCDRERAVGEDVERRRERDEERDEAAEERDRAPDTGCAPDAARRSARQPRR